MFLLLNVKYDLEMFSGRLIFTVLFEIDTTLDMFKVCRYDSARGSISFQESD